LSDEDLVKQCLKGKREAQKQLYDRFAPRMLGVCYRYAGSRDEAEDFLQEGFILVFRKLEQWKAEGELGAWIRRIMVNTSLNGIKAKHRLADKLNIIPIDSVAYESASEEAVSGNELMELIHQLPIGYKTVFNLYAIEGYSHEEIADLLGIKAGTSRSQYTRARELLMKRLRTNSTNKHNDGRLA
jgi:RNA polymerase sigma-70 factor (ECF subfamily)